jgi:hypothetical protein
MKSFFIFKLLIPFILICFLIPAVFSEAARIPSSDNKKDQIRQLETDLTES